jgi:flagellar export protein FliJ
MKAFRFTLEAVRIVRQRQEQEAMEEYARALLVRKQALEKLEGVQKDLQAAWQEFRKLVGGGCTAAKAAQAREYHDTLEQRRVDCAAALEAAERRVNATLNGMLAARRQREVVDKFYDKQKSRHGRELARSEQMLLDDLAGRRPSSILSWTATGALP